MGGTGGTAPTDYPALARALVNALLVDGKTLGEATRDALAQTSDPEVQSTFVLLGDPSARAVATQALEAAPKPAVASGCTSAASGPALGMLLALAAWLAALPRRRFRQSAPLNGASRVVFRVGHPRTRGLRAPTAHDPV